MQLYRCMVCVCGIAGLFSLCISCRNAGAPEEHPVHRKDSATSMQKAWHAPDTILIPKNDSGDLIRYGRQIIAATAFYFGPKGKIAALANGMNCQNCHLDAGTKPFGNNFGAVFSTYPRFRERRGAVETIIQRVNDCFERSMNGRPPDSNSREMKAILAYMKWLAKDVPKGAKLPGTTIEQPVFLEKAADTASGRLSYIATCQVCHGPNGQGLASKDSNTYLYPPLWGPDSYNTAAGLYRLSRFASYVKYNMPFGSDHDHPKLTDEDAWNIAAFVNSRPRPVKVFRQDYPDKKLKPVDYPFGPYVDSFSEEQHKYGPFAVIAKNLKNLEAKGKAQGEGHK